MYKPVPAIPDGFRNITPYLVVPGVASLLIFLKSAFNAEELIRATEPNGSVSHAGVKIGGSMLEMGDVGGTEQQPLTAGLHYYVRDVDAVYRQAIAAGAVSLYEPRQMDYGDREGGVQDHCGNHWYIATHKTGASYRPELMEDLNLHLSLHEAARFITFLQQAFQATVLEKHADKSDNITLATVRVGDTVLEISEAHGQFGPRASALHYYTENCDDVFARGLSAGAKVLLPIKEQVYGDRAGGLLDDWGNRWYIATHREDLSLEEIQRRDAASPRENQLAKENG
jgi:PhnB protein